MHSRSLLKKVGATCFNRDKDCARRGCETYPFGLDIGDRVDSAEFRATRRTRRKSLNFLESTY
jgi:hypothetical protein